MFPFDHEPQPASRCCDMPNCPRAGEYRAPKSRRHLNEYYWFCLDHVREYNKAWDYYAGMSPGEIERHVRLDTTWQRPTWPMGFWRRREERLREAAARHRGFAGDAGADHARSEEQADGAAAQARRRSPEDDALALLELVPPVSFDRIKARYRELVKRHHPDANGGDKLAEERLKQINQAYTTLKASYGG